MAKTYTAAGLGIALSASAKSLMGLLNAHASRKIAIQKVWILNNQQIGVTGVLTQLRLLSLSTLSSGSAITPIAHDTDNSAIDLTSITCASSPTVTETAGTEVRRFWWSGDEPVLSSASKDEMQCMPTLTTIYRAPIIDSVVTPLILNQNQGITISQNATTSNVGVIDCFIEFTVY